MFRGKSDQYANIGKIVPKFRQILFSCPKFHKFTIIDIKFTIAIFWVHTQVLVEHTFNENELRDYI